ncbi:MAG: type IV pilus modification protein PilV [Gammaproteobacteria bacterium]
MSVMTQTRQATGTKLHKSAGFTLLEVLVALFVLSVGLLGLASLQAQALRYNHNAYLRSVATQQAYDIADRIRANAVGLQNGAYDSITSDPGDPGCITSGCAPAQVAQFDAFEWYTALSILLPGGTGTVAGNGPDSLFTVTVTWNELETETGPRSISLVTNFRP